MLVLHTAFVCLLAFIGFGNKVFGGEIMELSVLMFVLLQCVAPILIWMAIMFLVDQYILSKGRKIGRKKALKVGAIMGSIPLLVIFLTHSRNSPSIFLSEKVVLAGLISDVMVLFLVGGLALFLWSKRGKISNE